MKTLMKRFVGRPVMAVVAVAVLALVAVPFIQAQIIPPITPPTTDPNGSAPQQPTGNERQPVITADGQFTTVTSGALQNRAPGLYVQQGLAVNNGTLDLFDGNVDDSPGFIGETFEMILLSVLDIINQFLTSLNLVSGNNSLSGLLPGGSTGSLTNLLTGGTGSGATVPVR